MMRAMVRAPLLILLTFSLLLPIARAQQPSAPAKPPTAAPSGELNFDLFAEEKKKAAPDEAREKERLDRLEKQVKLRRTLLKWHQGIGFVTLATLAATVIIGTLNYVDKYGGGDDTGAYYNAHLGLAVSASALFATGGTLALAAPNPYPKPIKFDAALVHKLSMAMAAACFVTQIILGPITMTREGYLDQRNLALSHLVIGWGAFAFMTAGTLAYVF
jgi:hypothetical protein